MNKILIMGLLFVALVGCNSIRNDTVEANGEFGVVTRVIDGDTFDLDNGERVRIICIDTPERGEVNYVEAGNRLRELVLDKEVMLVKDVSNRDRYDRLLRYVYVDDVFVNHEMVQTGFAKVYRYKPDVKLCDVIAS